MPIEVLVTPLLAFFAALGTSDGPSLEWPEEPPLLWQLEGIRLASKGAAPSQTIPRILRQSRRPTWNDVLEPETRILASWSTGGSIIRSEWAILLTPRGAARWLGFGRVVEGWGEAEVRSRWAALASQLQGRVSVIFCRTAYPKRAMLGIGSDSPPSLNRLGMVHPKLRLDGVLLAAQCREIIKLESRERKLIESAEWWNSTSLAVSSQTFALPPLGEYHRDWWWIEAPLSEAANAGTLRFTLPSPDRTQTVEWKL